MVSEFFPGLPIDSLLCRFPFIWIKLIERLDRKMLTTDCRVMLSRKFGDPKRLEILLAPEQARDSLDRILFERPIWGQFLNDFFVQFLEVGRLFARQNGGSGIAAVLEGGGKPFKPILHDTLRIPRYESLSTCKCSRMHCVLSITW